MRRDSGELRGIYLENALDPKFLDTNPTSDYQAAHVLSMQARAQRLSWLLQAGDTANICTM